MKYYFIYRNKENKKITLYIVNMQKTQEEINNIILRHNTDVKKTSTVKQIFDIEMQEIMKIKVTTKEKVLRDIKTAIKNIDRDFDDIISCIEQLKDYVSEVDGK